MPLPLTLACQNMEPEPMFASREFIAQIVPEAWALFLSRGREHGYFEFEPPEPSWRWEPLPSEASHLRRRLLLSVGDQFPPALIFASQCMTGCPRRFHGPNKTSQFQNQTLILDHPPLVDRPVNLQTRALGRRTSGGPGRRRGSPPRTCSACRQHRDLPCGHSEARFRTPSARASSPTVQSSGRDARFSTVPVSFF